MKTIRYALLFLPFVMFAQQPQPWVEQNVQSTFFSGKEIVPSTEQGIAKDVADWLCRTQPELCKAGSGLELQSYRKSIIGHHLLFQQTHRGVPIYSAFIKVNLSSNRGLLSIFEKTAETAGWSVNFFSAPLLPDELAEFDEVEPSKVVWVTSHGDGVAAWRYEAFRQDLLLHLQIIATPDGEILYRQKLSKNLTGKDTLKVISTKVFLPDPLTTANVLYGHDSMWVDNPPNNSKLDSQQVQVFTEATLTDSGYFLKSPYAEIKEMNAPKRPLPFRTDSIFHYSRGDTVFGAVNSFYHINNFQLYIQSLGITGLVNFSLPMDPHGYNTDNSSFLYNNNNPRLYFGLGGVDDAEDADVVIHEYAHALIHSASPNTSNGRERESMEEGIGDYFACSYSKHYENFGSERVYNWDGHNPFWDGRWCTSTKHYPEDLTGGLYADGELWCGTLMNIRAEIGREAADRLMLSIMYSFAAHMTMRDAAYLLLQSDSLLNNKMYDVPIRSELEWRGFIPVVVPEPLPDVNLIWSPFYSGENYVLLKSEKQQNVLVHFYSIDGKLLHQQEIMINGDTKLHLPQVSPGMYILKVSGDVKEATFIEKMIRIQ